VIASLGTNTIRTSAHEISITFLTINHTRSKHKQVMGGKKTTTCKQENLYTLEVACKSDIVTIKFMITLRLFFQLVPNCLIDIHQP